MAHKIQVKRGNKADLPTLDAGEFGLCQDTNELFIGNNGNKKIFPAETPEISDVVGLQSALDGKVDNARVLTDVPSNAKFTDTTYAEITTTEIDNGTASTLRTITGRRIKYILDKAQAMVDALSSTVTTALAGKVDNSKVLTDVPVNAKFTDTVTTINGKTGVITKSDITALGIPAQDTVYTHPATHSADMITNGTTNKAYTATEKTKLAGIAENANNYVHPTTAGNKHIPSGGATGQILKYGGSSGTAVWANESVTPVVDNLTSTDTDKALSANQGKVLNDLVSTHMADTANPHGVTAAQVGAVPTTRTVNSKALSSDITLSASDVGAVPTSRTVNGKALSGNITLTPTDISAVATANIVDNLTTNDGTKVLSAKQGKVLEDGKIAKTSKVNDPTTDGTAVPLSAEQGKTLKGEVGALTSLSTTEKGSLVGAINEVDNHADTNATSIGTLASLTTTEKTNLVGAINELNADKIETAAIANTLTETAEGKVLDARQGKVLADLVSNSSGVKTARFVVGTSTAGWTAADCDYLCDGTADDVEINAAITALPATGGEIVILDGTYNITAKIDVTKDNVSIRGNGNAAILKRMFNSSAPEGVITLTSRSGCKITNLQIEGNKTSYTNTNNYCIYLEGSSGNTITGNTCNNNKGYCICLSDSSNNTVTGNTCNNSRGIYLNDSSDKNTVTGNTCNNNDTHGIYLYVSIDNAVTGNTCNNNTGHGIYLNDSSDNNTVTGNTCNNNNMRGICLVSSSNNTVTGNTCNNNNTCGIYLDGVFNNTVTGNTCTRGTGLATDYNASQHTIQLSGTGNSYNLISNNNCMGKAVTVGGGTGNTLVNNKFDDSDDIQELADLVSTHTGATNPHGITKTTVGLDNVDNVKQATTTTYTTTLDTTWSGTKAPYTKEQTVTGILSTDNPIVDIVLSGTYATDSKIEADWAEIYRIVTSANSVTLYAHKKPTNSIPLQFKVVR